MNTFSIYIIVVVTSVFFIFTSSSSSSSRPTHEDEPRYSIELLRDEEKMIKAKVQRDLRKMRMERMGLKSTVGKISKGKKKIKRRKKRIPGVRTLKVSNKSEILTENELGVVKDYRQATLSEAAQTFNRKCLELEALLKEK